MSEHSHLTVETLFAVLILIVFIICGPIFEKMHFHYAHESGIVMILGIIVTLIVNSIDPSSSFAKTINFNHEIFFTLILPPIIFGAGYNLRRKFFFKYIFYILLFGVIGTAINFCLVAPLTLIINNSFGFTITNKVDIFDKQGKVIPSLIDENELGESSQHHHTRMLDLLNEVKNDTEEIVNKNNFYSNIDGVSEYIQNETNSLINQTKDTVDYVIDNYPSNNTISYLENNSDIQSNNYKNHNSFYNNKKTIEKYELHNETLIYFSSKEILLFASVISATDAVAALAFVKEESDPKLFPILFGEGVVNDAVCIVLYQIIKGFLDSGAPFSILTPFKMTEQFLRLFFMSLGIAIAVGVGSALFFKVLKPLKLTRVQECSLIVFFALITYSFTELIGLSPIVALLFSGIFMAHYAFYNLSFQSREESSIVTKMISTIAEGFVFVYMGLTVFYYFNRAFSISFVIYEFFILLFSRIAMVFGSCFVLEYEIKFSDKGIMAYSGTIRGAIAFGLACSLELDNELHRSLLISGTLALVLITTLVLGALMPMYINFMKSFDSKEDKEAALKGAIIPSSVENDFGYDFSHPNFNVETLISKEKDPLEREKRFSTYVVNLWKNFEEETLKPWLLYDYPNCIKEHEEVSKRLLDATAELSKEKKNVNLDGLENAGFDDLKNEKRELEDKRIFNPDI